MAIFDLNRVTPPPSQTYEICIAGGGVAGITLATDLASRGRRVLLLEAGGLDFTEESQEVYRGEIVGRSYFPLTEARLRFFGGSSNHWGGMCRPLDAHDFERHDHIPFSGWPLARSALDPYLDHACALLDISPVFQDIELPGSESELALADFHFSRPPARFGDMFLNELQTSGHIDVFLNANLVNVVLNELNGNVAAFQCANYTDSSALHSFTARRFVLALGGIENPRILLNSRSQMLEGIGNRHDLVGRFFMEHPHVLGGILVTNGAAWRLGPAIFAPTGKLMHDRRIANAGVRIWPSPDASETSLMGEIKHGAKRLVCGNDAVADFVRSFHEFHCPYDLGVEIHVACEQVPNPDSRVLLSEEVDRFGLRRGALDWQITALDRRTISEMLIALGSYLARYELGNIKLVDWLLDETQPVPGVGEDDWLGGGWHHMGTTRMAASAEQGVVDRDCRVFGLDNLYIAGSSVFPTGGHANPTLTIVQLALRLSDHLDRALGA